MKLNILNIFFSVLIILMNLYFLPFTIIQIVTTGGPMGFGLLSIPFTIIINSLLIPSYLALKSKYKNNLLILIINSLGFTISFILFLLLISTPKID